MPPKNLVFHQISEFAWHLSYSAINNVGGVCWCEAKMYQILQNRLRVSPVVAIAFFLFVLSGDASAIEESATMGFEENPTDVVSSDNSVEQTLTQSQAVEATDSTSSVLEQINQY
ncbi:MAG: hypothetical protein ICV85_04750, partial [Tolypothrix sp. T3-bin4]|nr:hypothetical protein [Tolypothrix sp. T3-bin4]